MATEKEKKQSEEKIEEVKKRLKEIERKTGRKINLNKILGMLFSRKNIEKGTVKVLKTADQMLKEDIKDYTEVGVKQAGDLKVEHGFRMRFLDDKKEKEDKSHIKWVKKKKRRD